MIAFIFFLLSFLLGLGLITIILGLFIPKHQVRSIKLEQHLHFNPQSIIEWRRQVSKVNSSSKDEWEEFWNKKSQKFNIQQDSANGIRIHWTNAIKNKHKLLLKVNDSDSEILEIQQINNPSLRFWFAALELNFPLLKLWMRDISSFPQS